MPWSSDDGRNERATAAATLIVEKERAERVAKTARLKEARLAREPTVPSPMKRTSKATKKVRRIFVAG